MSDLRTRLHTYLTAPGTWQIPAHGVLAGCAGTVLSALVEVPGFAPPGAGVVLGGVAITITSPTIGRILAPDTSERERVRLIVTGLEQHDPDMQALVGTLIGQVGAALSQALPPDERDDTIATLERGMQQAGGVLAALAPRYTAALRNPHTDWGAFQRSLHQHIATVHQDIRAANVIDTSQDAHHDGSITQTIHATQDVRGVTQRAGGRGSRPFVPASTNTGTTRPTSAVRVFLCHAHEDKPRVRTLYQRLADDGFAPWFDEVDLLPGQEWRTQIARIIPESAIFLACLSARAVTKTGYLNKEIVTALDVAEHQPEGTIFIIPARLEACPVPERLSRWQWVDLYQTDGYERLRHALQERAQHEER